MKRFLFIISTFFIIGVLVTSFSYAKEFKVIGIAKPDVGVGGGLYDPIYQGLRDGLSSLGHRDKKYVIKVMSLAKEGFEENKRIAKEFLDEGVDLVITLGTGITVPVVEVLKDSGIPIVFIGVTDPVGVGLVKALDKPTGTNITGIAWLIPQEKVLQYIKRVLPDAQKVGFLYDTKVPQDESFMAGYKKLKKTGGLKINYFDITSGIDADKLKKIDMDVFTCYYGGARHIKELAVLSQFKPVIVPAGLPMVKGSRAIAGIGLHTYNLGLQGANLAGKVLAGKSAGSLPVERPKRFELSVHLGSAENLGIDIPLEVIGAADNIAR